MRHTAALIAWLCLAFTAPATAEDVSSERILPGWRQADSVHVAGVEIILQDGWKTYWRAPGGNGIPPQFDFSRSENLKSASVGFPNPTIFSTFGVESIGYSGRVLFPIHIVPEDPAKPVSLNIDLAYGVCEEICIPVSAALTAVLHPGSSSGSDEIREAMTALPMTRDEAGILRVVCEVTVDGSSGEVAARIEFANLISGTPRAVFETGSEEIWVGTPSQVIEPQSVTLRAPMEYFGTGSLTLRPEDVRLTLLSAERSIDIQGCPSG